MKFTEEKYGTIIKKLFWGFDKKKRIVLKVLYIKLHNTFQLSSTLLPYVK